MFRFSFFYCCLSVVLLSCHGKAQVQQLPLPLKAQGYSIVFQKDAKESERWANYLYGQLVNRAATDARNLVRLSEVKDGWKQIEISWDSALSKDYQIDHREDRLLLKAKKHRDLQWLIYQFIQALGQQDSRFATSDLPPAFEDFSSKVRSFDFEYRASYFSPNLEADFNALIGAGDLEADWKLWGHNLQRAILSPRLEHQAWIGGKRQADQFCFSNLDLHNQLIAFVENQGAHNEEVRSKFAVVPNDNTLSCQCARCMELGNTPENAAPAVCNLLEKLAIQFPQYDFFTTAYLSVKHPPKIVLPANVGLLLSTIDLPKGVALERQPQLKQFQSVLKLWQAAVSKVYIWDYACNFDDYLTPMAFLYGFQKQLEFFKEAGISGVFLNGSAPFYSPFEDVKVYVAQALMMDAKLSAEQLIRSYFQQFYPQTAKQLTDFYLNIEERALENKRGFNLYGSFGESAMAGIKLEKLADFEMRLQEGMRRAEDTELQNLKRLHLALVFTQLQWMYHHPFEKGGIGNFTQANAADREGVLSKIQLLRQGVNAKVLTDYKEYDGPLMEYLSQWNKRIVEAQLPKNLLQSSDLKVQSPVDDSGQSIGMLTDGVPGFASDYHLGWYLQSVGDLKLSWRVNANLSSARHLEIKVLEEVAKHIERPKSILLYIGSKPGVILLAQKIEEKAGRSLYRYYSEVDWQTGDEIRIEMSKKSAARSTLAMDEINVY